MDLKKTAKDAAKFMAIKKGTKMTGGLLKWGALAGVGYLGYKFYKNRIANDSTTNPQSA